MACRTRILIALFIVLAAMALEWSTAESAPEFRVGGISNDAKVGSIYAVSGALLIGTSAGLYRLAADGTGAAQRVEGSPAVEVRTIYTAGSALLIGTSAGLYRLAVDGTGAAQRVEGSPAGDVGTIYTAGSALLIGTPAGLYRLAVDGTGAAQQVEGFPAGGIRSIYTVGSALLIGTNAGLYRLVGSQGGRWPTPIRFDMREIPSPFYVGNALRLQWVFTPVPFRIDDQNATFRVSLEWQRENGSWTAYGSSYDGRFIPGKEADSGRREFYYPTIKDKGVYRFKVVTFDVLLNESEAAILPITAYVGTGDVIKAFAPKVGLGLSILHMLVCATLVIGSRWSYRCLDFLKEPVLRKASLYLGPALTYISPIRIWVFSLYFHKLRQELQPEHTYLPTELRRPNGTTVSSDAMLQEIITNRRIWIRGEAGTGKSELVQEIVRLYTHQLSIEQAWRTFGYIPLLVNVRDYLSAPAIEQMARGALTTFGMVLSDESFFANLLRHGNFLVILDGMNEAGTSESTVRTALQNFAVRFPTVRILVTSQSALDQDRHFQEYELPTMEPDFARHLLAELLPKHISADKVSEVPTELWKEVRSGYDVLLLRDCLLDDVLPQERLALYEKATTRVTGPSKDRFPLDALYRKTWEMFKAGLRTLTPDGFLTPALMSILTTMHIVVQRYGDFSYRHDLMRASL